MATLTEIRDTVVDLEQIVIDVGRALDTAAEFLDVVVDLVSRVDGIADQIVQALESMIEAVNRMLRILDRATERIGRVGGTVGRVFERAVDFWRMVVERLTALARAVPDDPNFEQKVEAILSLLRRIQALVWAAGGFVARARQVIGFLVRVVDDLLENAHYIHDTYSEWFEGAAESEHLEPLRGFAEVLGRAGAAVSLVVRDLQWMVQDLRDFILDLTSKVAEFDALREQLDEIAQGAHDWWAPFEPKFDELEREIRQAIQDNVEEETREAIAEFVNAWQQRLDEATESAQPADDTLGQVYVRLEAFLAGEVGGYMDRLEHHLQPFLETVEDVRSLLRDVLENEVSLLRTLLRMLASKETLLGALPQRMQDLIRRLDELLEWLDEVLEVGMNDEQRQEAEQRFAVLRTDARTLLLDAPIQTGPHGAMRAGFIALAKVVRRLERGEQAFRYRADVEAVNGVREVIPALEGYLAHVQETVRSLPAIDRDPAYLKRIGATVAKTREVISGLPTELLLPEPDPDC